MPSSPLGMPEAGEEPDDDQDRIRDNYRGNYERLVAIKRQYDPTNLFHMNQNIKP